MGVETLVLADPGVDKIYTVLKSIVGWVAFKFRVRFFRERFRFQEGACDLSASSPTQLDQCI